MIRASLYLPLLFSLFSACDGDSDLSGDAGPVDGGEPEWITNEQRSPDVNRYMEAFCQREARCYNGNFHECNLNDLGASCGTGGETTKVEDLAACLKALAERPCDAGVISECLGARNALRAPGNNRLLGQGEACGPSNVIRCDFDLYCDAGPNQCGICRKQGEAGDACRDSSECLTDQYYCANGACAPRLAAGELCDELAFECELGLVCEQGLCTEVQAEDTKLSLIGQACLADADCYSSTCEQARCVARTRCGSGKEGDRCVYQLSCMQGYACDASRHCVPAQDRGEACDPSAALCAFGDFCEDETCKPQLENGADCEYQSSLYSPQCASGFCGPNRKCGPHEIVCPDERTTGISL